jgi:hypothetical protein
MQARPPQGWAGLTAAANNTVLGWVLASHIAGGRSAEARRTPDGLVVAGGLHGVQPGLSRWASRTCFSASLS